MNENAENRPRGALTALRSRSEADPSQLEELRRAVIEIDARVSGLVHTFGALETRVAEDMATAARAKGAASARVSRLEAALSAALEEYTLERRRARGVP